MLKTNSIQGLDEQLQFIINAHNDGYKLSKTFLVKNME